MRKLIYDITEFEYKREIPKRLTYPFYTLNKITGGAEVGALNILFAKTNAGKSEIALQFICHWIESGHKVCALLGEHTMRKAQALLYKKVSTYDKDKWVTVKYGDDKNGKDLGIYETFVSEEDEKKAIDIFRGNIFLYDTRNGFELDNVLKGFEDGFNNGCDVFVIDNAMMLQYEGVASELREQTDNAEKIRQWAKSHQVVCYLIAHSRKIEVQRIRLSETDIAGSSNVSNKATTILTITRLDTLNPNTQEYKAYAKLLEANYIDISKCDAILEAVKEKNGKGSGFVPLKWYESTKTFKEVYDKDMIDKKENDRKTKGDNVADKTILYTLTPVRKTIAESIFDSLDPCDDEELPF